MIVAVLVILQIVGLTVSFELPHKVIYKLLTFEAITYEFGQRECGYFLIASQRSVSLSKSISVIYALMGYTIAGMIIKQLVEYC